MLNIEDYVIQRQPLKSGKYGKVYRASKASDFSESIDKQLHVPSHVVPDVRKEISGLVQCRHNNVVAYLGYHYSHEEGILHILTEYCEDGSVRGLINDHRLSNKLLDEDTLTHYMHQFVRGLEFIHRKGMTHRDLKPENILIKIVGGEMLFKIADFGLATLLDLIDRKRGLLHWIDTVDYMAPEVKSGAEYGRACDIYSLGVIIFELAHLGLEKYHSTLKFEPLDEEQYSKELRDLVSRMLSIEPPRRPECYQILQSEVIEENVRRESEAVLSERVRSSKSQGSGEGENKNKKDKTQKDKKEVKKEDKKEDKKACSRGACSRSACKKEKDSVIHAENKDTGADGKKKKKKKCVIL